jgi:hypothetical protein
MGDPFRNPLASMSARVETLERENRELRAKISALNDRLESRPLREGRASWLLTGLVASFFPLVAAPFFFSAPKAPWLARRARPGPIAEVAPREGGESPGAFRGVALRAQADRDRAPPEGAPGGGAAGPVVSPRLDRTDPWATQGGRCAPGDPLCGDGAPAPKAKRDPRCVGSLDPLCGPPD